MKRKMSLKEIEQRKLEDDEDVRISRREKKRQQYGKKNASPYDEDENYNWENDNNFSH